MRRIARRQKPEPTIALINIVFLMLVFFLVAGTLAQPLDTALKLVQTRDLEGREPPDALVLHADGHLSFRGKALDGVTAFTTGKTPEQLAKIRIVPDRAAPASRLVAVTGELRAAGAQSVVIVTERALQ